MIAVVTVLLLQDEVEIEVVLAFEAFEIAFIELSLLATANHAQDLTYLTEYEYCRTSFLYLHGEFGVQVPGHPGDGHTGPILYYSPLFVEEARSIQ